MKKTYIIDIDGTICNSTFGEYSKAQPFQCRIEKVNKLFWEGNKIIYWTARGANTGIDWTDFTLLQLISWGCKFTEVRMGKPSYDVWVDDKAFNDELFFNNL
jgi:hypothetical protein